MIRVIDKTLVFFLSKKPSDGKDKKHFVSVCIKCHVLVSQLNHLRTTDKSLFKSFLSPDPKCEPWTFVLYMMTSFRLLSLTHPHLFSF